MNTETLEYKGYKIIVAQDESPSNPFENGDSEPPTLTYYGGRNGYAKSYCGAPETLREILHLLPAATWERGNRMKFYKEFMADKFGLKEVAGEIRRHGNTFDAIEECLTAGYGSKPDGWRAATEWFEMAESLLTEAGIPCLNEQSNGYSQGDSTLVLVILTPEWVKMVGVDKEHFESCMRGSFNLYSAWAWGDVYGISRIIDPDGDELDDGSVWGFYGSDHEENGLLESARGTIDWNVNALKETALNEPACLI